MKSKEPSSPKRTLSSALRSLSRQVSTTRQKSLPFSSPSMRSSEYRSSSQSKMFYKRVNPDRIKINPSTAVFDRMANEAKEEGSLRVLRAKGDWYVWPSSANIHTDIIDYFDLADRSKGDMPHVSSAQSKKDPMKMMIGVSLELVSDPDTNHSSMMLMVYSDVIWERDIARIEKELKKDRKFCEMTKNWKVHNVHGVTKPKTNQGREWLRGRIARDIKLNLAENTSRKEFHPHLEGFIDFACDKLGIFNKPTLKYKTPDDQGEQPSFAAYSPSQKEITIMTKNRHPMDIFRSVAHELVHHKQNEDGKLGKDIAKEGETGSDIENEANSDAGKVMRWFAKANPDMFGKSFVTEGINDRGIFKAVFLAGGAGSGKDFILSKCIAGNGLQELNSDKAFEMIMKKENYPMVMNGHDPHRDMLRGRAKTVTQHRKGLQLGGRLGVIINGTADDYNKIAKLKQEYENLGYDTMMVFVTTSNKTSRQRNVARGDSGGRTVPENIRFAKWRGANVNKDKFAQLFGSNFVQIDNDADLRTADPQTKARYDKMHTEVFRKVRAFVSKPVANPRSKIWLDAEKRARGISEMDEKFTNLMQVGGAGNWGTPQLTDRYKRDTPGETPGKTKEMGYHNPKENSKIGIHPYMADGNSVKVFGNLPIKGEKIGTTFTSAKNPSFVGDTTSDPNSAIPPEPFSKWSPIDRWSVNEETKRRFKARYGELAEQKIRETVNKLKESLTDPFDGSMGATPNSSNIQDNGKPDINAEFEKVALFGKKHKKTKYIKK